MFKSNVLRLAVSSIFMVLTLSACAPKAAAPAPVLSVQDLLAEELGVPVDEIEIVSMEEMEWTDSCFGLGGAAEICAAEMTPGWQIDFDVNGEQYEVRSNQTGTIIRTVQP